MTKKQMRLPIATAAQVMSAKPGVSSVTGATGLYLRKSEAGAGSWFFRYRKGARQREKGLGPAFGAGAVTLAQARDRATDERRRCNNGVDPIDADREARKQARDKAQAEARKVTFRQAAESYVKEFAPTWKHRYARQNWLGPVSAYAYPEIGDTLLEDIKVANVRRVIDAARKKAPGVVRRLRGYIKSVLDDAAERGWLDEDLQNPADAKRHRKSAALIPPVEHYPRVPLDDAPAVFRRILELSADSTALSAWAFMILTAVRPSEALEARWSEIDVDKRLWRIPAARMKGKKGRGNPHAVPLSERALAVLKRQATVKTSDAVFPGMEGSPLNYSTFKTATLRALIDAKTAHGWRSVFRDACGDRLRVDRDLAEAALSHTLGAVEGAYRRETAIEARRSVMERYANWLLDEGAEIIAFPATRS